MIYKDSQIPWIGNIPAHWEVARGKQVLTLLNRPIREDDEIVTCFHDGTVTLRARKTDRRVSLSIKEDGYQGIEPGDLVIHGMDGFAGAIGISDARGKSTPALLVLDSPHNKRYLMYYLRMAADRNVFQSLTNGIRNHSCDLCWNKLAVFPVLLPTRAEQDRIAEYLDRAMEKIDAIVAEAHSSIEDYKVWKASRIYEVLTKGLDPDAALKDSGIGWLDQIPAGWTVRRLKYLVTEPLRQGTPESSIDYQPDLPRYIRITDIAADGTLKEENKRALPETVPQEYLLEDGDVLFARSGETAGKAFLYRAEYGKAAFASYLIRARIDRQIIHPKLVCYATLAAGYNNWKTDAMSSSVIKNISTGKYSDLSIAIPPITEQERLIDYIERQILPIEDSITRRAALITDLQSYKNALIYEAVTGKQQPIL
jgi:type I restriction enzyme S subunit